MKFITNLMYRVPVGRDVEKYNLLWNMVGSIVYAITSMLIGIAVTKLVGAKDGGIFFFAFTTLGQQMYIVSYFGMRPIQITDISMKNSFAEYRNFRILTAVISFLIGLIYTLLIARDMYMSIIWILMIIYKVLDGFSDVYESEYQRHGKLYITGKSTLLRTLLSVSVFLAVLFFTGNLLLGSFAFVIALIIGIYIFSINPMQGIDTVLYTLKKGYMRQLLELSIWLFLSASLDLYIFGAAKYAVNTHMNLEYNTYFSIIFIPTSIINLMAGFLIRPLLTKLSLLYENKNKKEFSKILQKLFVFIIGLTAIATLTAYYLSIPLLRIVLGKALGEIMAEFKPAIIMVIMGGGFYAILNLMYYILVIFNQKKSIFFTYVSGVILAFFVSNRLVILYGINGAALSYLLLMISIAVMFLIFSIKKYRNMENK